MPQHEINSPGFRGEMALQGTPFRIGFLGILKHALEIREIAIDDVTERHVVFIAPFYLFEGRLPLTVIDVSTDDPMLALIITLPDFDRAARE